MKEREEMSGELWNDDAGDEESDEDDLNVSASFNMNKSSNSFRGYKRDGRSFQGGAENRQQRWRTAMQLAVLTPHQQQIHGYLKKAEDRMETVHNQVFS